ncbi:MAG TPA: hypothetical protein VMT97_10095 [Terriglobales bacterium]|nr:hypothetical protein [Terriglobales bacterium]
MTRRRILQLLVGAAGAVLALLVLWRPQRFAQVVSRRFKPRLDATAPGVLSTSEMQTLVAFAAVLVEGRELDAQEASYMVEHITDKAGKTPGYLALYRKTADLLDRLAGAPFSSLSLEQRTGLMKQHGFTDYDVRIRECLLPWGREALAVRALAVPDLIGGYYFSPAGWAAVGYRAFPSRCGELTRYTSAEA